MAVPGPCEVCTPALAEDFVAFPHDAVANTGGARLVAAEIRWTLRLARLRQLEERVRDAASEHKAQDIFDLVWAYRGLRHGTTQAARVRLRRVLTLARLSGAGLDRLVDERVPLHQLSDVIAAAISPEVNDGDGVTGLSSARTQTVQDPPGHDGPPGANQDPHDDGVPISSNGSTLQRLPSNASPIRVPSLFDSPLGSSSRVPVAVAGVHPRLLVDMTRANRILARAEVALPLIAAIGSLVDDIRATRLVAPLETIGDRIEMAQLLDRSGAATTRVRQYVHLVQNRLYHAPSPGFDGPGGLFWLAQRMDAAVAQLGEVRDRL